MSVKIEKKLDSRLLYDGKILHVSLDHVEVAGNICQREVVRHPGASAIIAVTDKKEILFVKQYRYAIGKELLEIPAGKRDFEESPESCAARELEEETGYRGVLTPISSIYTTPGFCDETIYIYVAKNLIKTKPHPDENEYLDIVLIPLTQVWQMIADGRIRDAKTLAAFALAHDYLHTL